jgi:ribosome recycling factor
MVNQALWNIEEKMKASAEGLKVELASIRTGHASPALVEHIKADYAGVPTPLNQMAAISAPEARLIVIQPWAEPYHQRQSNPIEPAPFKRRAATGSDQNGAKEGGGEEDSYTQPPA